MNSPSWNSKKSRKIAIPTEAWEVLNTILGTGVPDPTLSLNELVAREERRRIQNLLELHFQPLNYQYTGA